MAKILYVLNIAPRVNNFAMSSILAARHIGLDMHIAGNWGYKNAEERYVDAERLGITIHQIDYQRNPLSPANAHAFRQLSAIIEREAFDIVHCNTPIGGVHGRLAARKYRVPAVIYQVHGYHFYKGGPLNSWLMYYLVEKWLARFTDILITINTEDDALARKTMRVRRQDGIRFVPGVGIDTVAYAQVTVNEPAKRAELGIPADAMLALSVGELNDNKNHRVILQALQQVPGLHYAIAGVGERRDDLLGLAKELGVADRLHLLGFREDVRQVYKAADMFLLPSFREGLSASVMEAMASGLPVICSDIRGNRDLVTPQGGYLVKPQDADGFAHAMNTLVKDAQVRADMGAYNVERIKNYDVRLVTQMLQDIYTQLMGFGR